MSTETSLQPVAKLFYEDRGLTPLRTGILHVYPNQTVKVGRDPDEVKNSVVFDDPEVSRNHMEFFCIVVDDNSPHSPLVFVRDRRSFNGTFVNGKLTGRAPSISPAILLQHGDTITISSRIKFVFSQVSSSSVPFPLSFHQCQEAALFKDKYVITNRTLGDGANALVYLAYDVSTGQQVACKVHDIGRYPWSTRRLQRIRQEAILLGFLDHPNILAIKAAFQTDQTIYIFTELATGGDLFSLFSKYGVFTALEIRWIVHQVLRGLVYLHGKGVAHRDIKPENILCAIAPDAACRITLSDFGDAAMTSSGRMRSEVGTSFYRAPESHSPWLGHGLAVDIWAVGMLTLQLLAGQEELPELYQIGLNSQQNIDEYLDVVLETIHPLSQLSEDGKDFIRGCLTHSGESRMTAREALRHGWLQQPLEDRELFRHLESAIYASWKPRNVVFPILQDITGKSMACEQQSPGTIALPAANTVSQHFATHDSSLSRPSSVSVTKQPATCRKISTSIEETSENQSKEGPQPKTLPLTPRSLRRAARKLARRLGAPKRKASELEGRPAKRSRSI